MGNTMVSSDVEYRFLVNKDVTIIAKFTTNTTPNTHEHAGNTSIWSKDTNGHWHECGNDGCDIAENSSKSARLAEASGLFGNILEQLSKIK